LSIDALVHHAAAAARRVAAAAAAIGLLATALPAAAAMPDVQQWTTDNGARVMFIEAHEIPAVNVQMTFAAGSARDGEHPGIAHLASDLLMSGTADMDADALARAYENEGAEVSTGAARDMGWVEFRSLSEDEHLQPVARTVARMTAAPAFPDAEIERVRSQQKTSLENKAQSPGDLARRAFWKAAYGDHPYAHEPLGTPDSLDATTRADLQAFHDRYYVARNANLAIVGDLTRERAQALAETLTGPLAAGKPAPALPPVPKLEHDRTIHQPFPSTQAHVLIGRPAIARGYERWPALYVANHVLGGGGFSSRLMTEVREKRGLVYGVYSYVSPMAAAGPFIIGLQTRGDQTDQAVGIVRKEFDRFYDEGPTTDEVDDAVKNIAGGFPLRIDSNADLSGYLSMMGFYGLPTDYLSRFRNEVREVDATAAHAAFADAVGQRPRVTVIVGGDRADSGHQGGQGAQ